MILKDNKRYDQERNKEIKKRRKGLKEILKDYHHEYEFFWIILNPNFSKRNEKIFQTISDPSIGYMLE